MKINEIKFCARCGGIHKNIEIQSVDNHSQYTHFALCPINGQPILIKQVSNAKRTWEKNLNSESKDGTWEFINNNNLNEKDNLQLLFFNYLNQGSDEEILEEQITLKLTNKQFTSLLKFCKKLNKKII